MIRGLLMVLPLIWDTDCWDSRELVIIHAMGWHSWKDQTPFWFPCHLCTLPSFGKYSVHLGLGVISCTSQCNPQFLCHSQAPLLLLLVIPRWSDGALLVPQLPPTSLLVPQLLPSSITFTEYKSSPASLGVSLLDIFHYLSPNWIWSTPASI